MKHGDLAGALVVAVALLFALSVMVLVHEIVRRDELRRAVPTIMVPHADSTIMVVPADTL